MRNIALVSSMTEALEGIQELYEGDQVVYSVTKLNVTTISDDATLQMWVYKKSKNVTSDVTTGSMSATKNVATTKLFSNLTGGDMLHVTLQGTCDGQLLTFAAFWLKVRKRSGLA